MELGDSLSVSFSRVPMSTSAVSTSIGRLILLPAGSSRSIRTPARAAAGFVRRTNPIVRSLSLRQPRSGRARLSTPRSKFPWRPTAGQLFWLRSASNAVSRLLYCSSAALRFARVSASSGVSRRMSTAAARNSSRDGATIVMPPRLRGLALTRRRIGGCSLGRRRRACYRICRSAGCREDIPAGRSGVGPFFGFETAEDLLALFRRDNPFPLSVSNHDAFVLVQPGDAGRLQKRVEGQCLPGATAVVRTAWSLSHTQMERDDSPDRKRARA